MVGILTSCSKDSKDSFLDWEIGDSTIALEYDIVPANSNIKMEITDINFCKGNAYIELIVKENGNVVYTENVSQFPYSKDIPVTAKSNVNVLTRVANWQNPGSNCIQLGAVKCKVTF